MMVDKPNLTERSDSPDRLNDFLRHLVYAFRSEDRSDVELLAQFVETGDQEAFRAIVGRYGRSVWVACLAVLGDPNDAEDAFQAAFVALARSAESVDARRGIGPWVRSAARAAARKLRRGASRLSRLRERVASEVSTTEQPPSDESQTWVLAAEELERLPQRLREAVTMYHLDGRTFAQIAELLECSVTEARRRVSRGLEKLRVRLSARGVTLTAGLLAAIPTGLTANAASAASALAHGLPLASPRVSALADAILAPRFPAWLAAVGATLLLAAGTAVALVAYPAPQKPELPSIPIAISAGPPAAPAGGPDGLELAPVPRPSNRVFRHDGAVTALVVSPDGKHLASAGADLVIRVWDSATGKQVARFDAPPEGVTALTFTPDGSALVAEDPKIGLAFWDLATGKSRENMASQATGVDVLILSSDGKRLVTIGRDGKLVLSDLTRPLGSPRDRELVVEEQWAKFWSRSFPESSKPASRVTYAAAFTPDSRTIFTVDSMLNLGRMDVQTRRAEKGQLAKHLKGTLVEPVTTVALSPGGSWMAWGNGNNKIGLIDLVQGERTHQMFRGHGAPVAALTFTADERTLASVDTDGRVIRWTLSPPAREFELRKSSVRFRANVLTFSPDGKRLYGADANGEVCCWDAISLEIIKPVAGK